MNEIIEKESIKVENVNTLKDYNLRILGNTEQDGTPTPENPVNIRVVTGDNKVTISNADNTKKQEFPINLGSLELCKIGDYQDYIYKQDDKWWKHKEIEKANNPKFYYNGIHSTEIEMITDQFSNVKNGQNYILNINNNVRTRNYMLTFRIPLNLVSGSTEQEIGLNAETYINSKTIIAYYILNTPINEQITDSKLISQLNNLNNAILYSGENNIITTISPLIDGEGTSITLENTVNTPFNNIILKGNIKQQKYSGKNLVPITAQSVEKNGVTFTINNNQLTLNGTATNYILFFLNNEIWSYSANNPILEAGTYNFSFNNEIKFIDDGGIAITIYNENSKSIYSKSKAKNNFSFSISEKGSCTIRMEIAKGQVFDNNDLQFQIEQGSTATDYEPYVGGTASPNPDYPQDIKVVTGDNTIKISNKNLLPLDRAISTTINGVIIKRNDDQSITFKGKATESIRYNLINNINLTLNGNYTYIAICNGTVNPTQLGGFQLLLLNQTPTTISFINDDRLNPNGLNYRNMNITTSQILKDLRFVLVKDSVIDMTIKFMLLQGTYNTSNMAYYEPYKQQVFPISLGSLELCKIGDYQDYIYNNNGKWYKHKVIKKTILNGTEKWTYYDELKVFFTDDYKGEFASSLCFSNFFIGKSFNGNNGAIQIGNTYHSSYQTLHLTNWNITTLSDWKNWLSNNKPIVYFTCYTPTEEEITDTTLITQLNNLSKATTYAGETNIVATSDGNNLPVTNYIKAYSSEIINESYPYLDLKYNLPYTEKLENLDFYLNENGRLVIKNVGTYLCSISESEIPDMPEASETTVKIAGRDGDLVLATTYNPIQFSIVIYTDENLSPAEKIEERQKIYKFFHEMKNTFKTFGIEAASKFYRVKYAGDVECENHPKHLKFTLPFKSSVSYGYNFKDKELIGNNIAISNTIEPVGFKCIINGPATNPTISLNNNEMKYKASIVNNEKIIIDTNNSTVTSITDNNESNAIVHYNRVFPKIQNGKNELKILSGIDNPTQVKIEWNDYNL